MTNKANMGCVIGRFQLDELHQGHLSFIGEVASRHESLMILVGCTEAQPDSNNPLDFEARRIMLSEHFPDACVLPLYDHPSDEVWSQTVDMAIKTANPRGNTVLYGSRDSFIPHYSGTHRCVEIVPTGRASGSRARSVIAANCGGTAEFRRGVIWARANQYPVSFQAVDIVLTRPHPSDEGRVQVALGKRSKEDIKWRFPGGFVDPTDASLEAAAKRELTEEVGAVETGVAVYLGSRRVEDYRYMGSKNALMTACFLVPYVFGALQAGDDLNEAQWHDLEDLETLLTDEHRMLGDMVTEHYTQA